MPEDNTQGQNQQSQGQNPGGSPFQHQSQGENKAVIPGQSSGSSLVAKKRRRRRRRPASLNRNLVSPQTGTNQTETKPVADMSAQSAAIQAGAVSPGVGASIVAGGQGSAVAKKRRRRRRKPKLTGQKDLLGQKGVVEQESLAEQEKISAPRQFQQPVEKTQIAPVPEKIPAALSEEYQPISEKEEEPSITGVAQPVTEEGQVAEDAVKTEETGVAEEAVSVEEEQFNEEVQPPVVEEISPVIVPNEPEEEKAEESAITEEESLAAQAGTPFEPAETENPRSDYSESRFSYYSTPIFPPTDVSEEDAGESSLEQQEAPSKEEMVNSGEPELGQLPAEIRNYSEPIEEVSVTKPVLPEHPVTSHPQENGKPAAFKFAEAVASGIGGVTKGLGSALKSFKIGYLIGAILIGLVGGGVYYLYSSGIAVNAYNSVVGFFTPKAPEKVNVQPSEEDRAIFGVTTALLFASNSGSVNDRVPVQISVADYFGRLMEPRVKGETGISAATYYGELKDLAKDVNEFISYVRNLEQLQALYEINVYDMLDRTTERDKALIKYLDDLKTARDQSNEVLRSIQLNLDDIAASYNSLNPSKSKYESDFFTALDQLKAEQSDVLLKGFVDITQKQAALKARSGALTKLKEYYVTALGKLGKRIMAVEQNQSALVQGIHVVDVPGGGIDLIIHPQQVSN